MVTSYRVDVNGFSTFWVYLHARGRWSLLSPRGIIRPEASRVIGRTLYVEDSRLPPPFHHHHVQSAITAVYRHRHVSSSLMIIVISRSPTHFDTYRQTDWFIGSSIMVIDCHRTSRRTNITIAQCLKSQEKNALADFVTYIMVAYMSGLLCSVQHEGELRTGARSS
jgi:hypothetical protein